MNSGMPPVGFIPCMNMIRRLLTYAWCFCCASAWAQTSILEIANPAPRAGEEVEIIITVKKESLEAIETKEKKSTDDYAALRKNKIAYGNLKISQVLPDTGKVKIGPFRFSIADRVYETNSLTLRVYPKLPDTAREGLWIRQVDYNGQSYLIIEQRSETEDAKFAQLNRDKLEASGLNIVTSTSKSESQFLDKKITAGSTPVNYRISTYKFKRTSAFKGKVKIDKSLFLDFPPNVSMDELWIKG
ncbi:hypothetical protein SAMN04488109_4144 [Chryseolinea serpens]|uniref:Oxygen tolerance n=2 Tax=Chryseolinea serpens TaxID=947013 RepID=A0A1M5TKZ0_9BACT|nr:hypothetical protein SAMN04488109_4144 [Chryseolinea serpens]